MVKTQQILFLCGRLVVRSLFAALTAYCPVKYLVYIGVVTLIPIIGWLRILFVAPRETGPEVFGGKIWWQNIRIIHLVMWTIAAIFLFTKNGKAAAAMLFVDVALGLFAFVLNYSVKK